jgi:hypothetical protein
MVTNCHRFCHRTSRVIVAARVGIQSRRGKRDAAGVLLMSAHGRGAVHGAQGHCCSKAQGVLASYRSGDADPSSTSENRNKSGIRMPTAPLLTEQGNQAGWSDRLMQQCPQGAAGLLLEAPAASGPYAA